MTRQIAVLDAPSNLGLMPPSPGSQPGVRRLPSALRERDFVSRIGAFDAGAVPAAAYDPGIDPQSGVRNSEAIASFARALAERVTCLIQADHFPLVLGGDCSILLGPMLALRRIGRYGLCFIDGHLDLLTPETSQSKGAAGMNLALALGYGPPVLANMDNRGPLVQETDVAVLGYRGEVSGYGALTSKDSRPDLLWLSLAEVRSRGASNSAQAALSRFTSSYCEGFWVHLDVDVLDDQVMPAVDSRQPGGMTYVELYDVLSELLRSPSATGMEVTILNPELDPDGSVVDRFATFMQNLFANILSARFGSA